MKKVISAVLSVVITAVMLVVPAAAASKLAAPAKFRAAAKSTSAISLSWSAVEGATKYTIFYSTAKKGEYKKYGTATKTTATVKNLDAGTKYFFRVAASGKVNGKTVSGAYSTASAVTKKASSGTTLKITKSPGTVSNNNEATLVAVGKPDTDYILTVYYSSKASEAKGTGVARSDKNGRVSWTWKVGANTKPGTHKITITEGGETVETTFTTEK